MERLSRYILRRLLVLTVGVLLILTVEFYLFRVLPDDPLQWALPAGGPYGPSATADWIIDWREQVTDMFNQPLYVQYFEFIGDMLTGDFGASPLLYESDISDHIYPAMWKTLILFGTSLLFCLVLAPLIGRALSRVRSYHRRQTLSFLPIALFSIPVVAWGWFLRRYLSTEWGLLPAVGSAPFGSSGIHLEYLVLPLISIILASFGAYVLCVRDGQTRASTILSPKHSTMSDGLFVNLPSMQFIVAASMLFVACAEWWFDYTGLMWNFMHSLYAHDFFSMQAVFFLLAIMVFMANFAMETVVTVMRPERRLDQYLREDRPATSSDMSTRVDKLPFSFSRIGGILVRVMKDYFVSPVGIVSLAVFIGIAVLAVVGPSLSSGETTPIGIGPSEELSTALILDGATALVAIPLMACLLAMPIGMLLGIVAGHFRPYLNGIVTAMMQGLISIPFIALIIFLSAIRLSDPGYFETAIACSVPVMALITLLSLHGFVSTRSRVVAPSGQASKGANLFRALPAVASWSLGGLKYGMPLTVVTVFMCDFVRITGFSSWGHAFEMAVLVSWYPPIEWEYILLPLIGSALLIGSIFLILDTMERVIRTRFSELI